jgi:hypothetical protein
MTPNKWLLSRTADFLGPIQMRTPLSKKRN